MVEEEEDMKKRSVFTAAAEEVNPTCNFHSN